MTNSQRFNNSSDFTQRALPTLTLTAPTQISERHHTDPPRLWFGVILGSVLIHLLGLGMLYWLMVRQQTSEVGTDPIPVDIVAVSPKDSPLTRPEASIRKYVPADRQSSRVTSNSTLRNQQAVVPKNQVLPTDTGTDASLPQNSQPSPTSNAAEGRRSSSTSQDGQQARVNRQQDNNKSSRLPSQESGIKSQQLEGRDRGTGTRENKETQNHRVEPQPQQSGSPKAGEGSKPKPSPLSNAKGQDSPPKDTPKPGPRPKPVPPAPPSSGNNNPPPSPPNSPPKPSPSPKQPQPQERSGGLVATLSNMQPSARGRDLPDPNGWAKPVANKTEINTIYYPSPALKNLKQVLVVGVYLVIDNTGKVESAEVKKGSGKGEVDQQALKILKNWKFKPATQGGKPVYCELEVDLQIAPRPS